MKIHKKLLILCVYPITWKITGAEVNDFWKYIPITLSNKNKVIFFSFFEKPLTKRYFFSNFFRIVSNYIFSPLIIFQPIEGRYLSRIHIYILLLTLGVNKQIVTLSGYVDERMLVFPKWLHPLRVYDCTDQVCDMIDKAKDLIGKDREGEFIKHCDITFVNSSSLFHLKRRYSQNVIRTSAGFPLEAYFRNMPIRKKNNQTIVGYIGAISFRLDFEVLKYAIQNNPEVHFVFIGQYLDLQWDWNKRMNRVVQTKKKWREILAFHNVEYLGYLERKDIYAQATKFDVGIVPYDVSQEFNRYCNPVKFYEYLAMGKPVVSTDILELRKYKTINNIHIALDREDFSNSIQGPFFTSDRYVKWARSEARKNDIKNKAAKMISEISKRVDYQSIS